MALSTSWVDNDGMQVNAAYLNLLDAAVNAVTTATVWTTSTAALTTAGAYWVYAGSAATTATLPAVSSSSGQPLIIENTTNYPITLVPQGSDYIWFRSALSTFTIGPYGSLPLICANGYWNALSVDLANNVAGILAPANGGTGASAPGTRVNSITSSATPAINVGTTDQFEITALAAAITSMTSGLSGTAVDGQKLLIRITDNGTARAITWGASFVSSGVATLLATTVASKTHMIGLIYNSVKAAWVCMAVDATGY